MSLANAKITQLAIPVSDFEQAVAFYRDVLELPFLFSAPPQMAFFNCGGVRLLVGVLPPTETPQRGSTIYFHVPNIHDEHTLLEGRGVSFRARPHVVHRTADTELWLAEFVDPDGNQFALMSELPRTDAS